MDVLEAEALERREKRRINAIYIGLLVLLLGCIGLGVYSFKTPESDQTFGFIALLIIFMTALAASSLVFVGLNVGSKEEAFGLPSGSVRALIAIGIMILFVVFGMPVVSSEPKELFKREASVPADQLAAVIKLNNEQGYVVRIADAGGPAGPGGTPAARPATIEIVRMNSVTDAQMDLNKQMLTAIVTLLTTVVGFYFGSRSATDILKAAPVTVSNTEPKPEEEPEPEKTNGNGNGTNGEDTNAGQTGAEGTDIEGGVTDDTATEGTTADDTNSRQ